MTLPRLRLNRLRAGPKTEEWRTLTARTLQERYLADIYRYVARRVVRREDAEDITAECFAAAFAALPGFRGACEVRLWLLGIARRKVADAMRKAARQREVLVSETDELSQALSTAPTPADALDAQEARQRLRQLMAALPEPQREALLLHYVEGLSHAEIGIVMGRSPAAINSLLQRARAAILRDGRAYFLDDEVRA